MKMYRRAFRGFRGLVYQAPLWQFILLVAALILEVADLRLLLPHVTGEILHFILFMIINHQ